MGGEFGLPRGGGGDQRLGRARTTAKIIDATIINQGRGVEGRGGSVLSSRLDADVGDTNDERREWRFPGIVLKEEAGTGSGASVGPRTTKTIDNQPPRLRSKGWRVERQRPYARVDAEEEETIIERGVEGAASSGTGERGGLLM